ncbi:hypothetical protein I7I50_09671 [Histoplasma capsulatum G186AR]|uniref:Uncharacterized protein n=1 Tax=Ajellomyces capsulatus TaxID=5037 RepID=A0A8H7YUQ5_AJECA|nr:hypothetical protein I7I52_07201 [Histoplasma capsulatum]QSS74470.1 hypothetical protein I7I50_09671 [Histoplasma capsulatum G186AR]
MLFRWVFSSQSKYVLTRPAVRFSMNSSSVVLSSAEQKLISVRRSIQFSHGDHHLPLKLPPNCPSAFLSICGVDSGCAASGLVLFQYGFVVWLSE